MLDLERHELSVPDTLAVRVPDGVAPIDREAEVVLEGVKVLLAVILGELVG